jgi:hypothetical protein
MPRAAPQPDGDLATGSAAGPVTEVVSSIVVVVQYGDGAVGSLVLSVRLGLNRCGSAER